MSAQVALFVATFIAAFVEFVEALTIVLAMGLTRGWRSALAGTVTAILALVVFAAAIGYALATWLPRTALELVVGVLLLIFGLQWLRKAILRCGGRKALSDEDAKFRARTNEARAIPRDSVGIDPFGFVVCLKGVFLEGTEVVFIVITFGLNANNVPVATIGAAAAGVIVIGLGFVLHRPLAAVPENTLKYVVGLMLATFGTYWSAQGVGAIADGARISWPGADFALLAIFVAWFGLSRVLIAVIPKW